MSDVDNAIKYLTDSRNTVAHNRADSRKILALVLDHLNLRQRSNSLELRCLKASFAL